MWDTTAVPGLLGINEGVLVHAPSRSTTRIRPPGHLPPILLAYLKPAEDKTRNTQSDRFIPASAGARSMEDHLPM